MTPQPKRKRTRDEGTAYHEAGHAVALFFIPHASRIKHATIVPDKDQATLGHVRHRPRPSFHPDCDNSSRTRLRIEAEVIVSLAGGIAEKRAVGCADHVGAKRDYEHAADMAMMTSQSEEETNAFLRWLEIRARGFVEIHWAEIRAVAAALLREKTLSGKHIRKIIQRGATMEI